MEIKKAKVKTRGLNQKKVSLLFPQMVSEPANGNNHFPDFFAHAKQQAQ